MAQRVIEQLTEGLYLARDVARTLTEARQEREGNTPHAYST